MAEAVARGPGHKAGSEEYLIDEYRLFVSPVILGAGTPYFPALDARINLGYQRGEDGR